MNGRVHVLVLEHVLRSLSHMYNDISITVMTVVMGDAH